MMKRLADFTVNHILTFASLVFFVYALVRDLNIGTSGAMWAFLLSCAVLLGETAWNRFALPLLPRVAYKLLLIAIFAAGVFLPSMQNSGVGFRVLCASPFVFFALPALHGGALGKRLSRALIYALLPIGGMLILSLFTDTLWGYYPLLAVSLFSLLFALTRLKPERWLLRTTAILPAVAIAAISVLKFTHRGGFIDFGWEWGLSILLYIILAATLLILCIVLIASRSAGVAKSEA